MNDPSGAIHAYRDAADSAKMANGSSGPSAPSHGGGDMTAFTPKRSLSLTYERMCVHPCVPFYTAYAAQQRKDQKKPENELGTKWSENGA